MHVLLIDDSPITGARLPVGLGRPASGVVTRKEKDLAGALEYARCSEKIDLVFFELGSRGPLGVEALTWFRREFPEVPVIVVSDDFDRASILAALDAGATGYLPKGSIPEILIASLRASEPLLSNNLKLTLRQAEVHRLLLQGLPNKQIAMRLEIADDTVKKHLSAIYRVLGVSSRMEALAGAARRVHALN